MPITIQAEENNNVIIGFNNSVINKIDNYFLTQPKKKNIIWTPKIKSKSRYGFSISRDAYYLSKTHADASDLYYLTKKIDNGLKFQPSSSKYIDFIISENNSYLIYRQNILSNINAGLFIENKENKSFGLYLNKDMILNKNALGNFGFEQAEGEYTVFNAKFVKLLNNEKTEIYGNIDHQFKSDHINVRIGNTWFDIADQFDLTLGVVEQSKKVASEFYASFGNKNIKFQIGLDQIKNSSDMNMFFNLKFENSLNKSNLGTSVLITSRDNVFGLRNLSLKSFRKKNLDMLWKKYINFK